MDYPFLLSILLILITFVIFFLWRRKRTLRTDILLTGICDSGKTFLFSQLLYSESKETYTSIAENIGEYSNEKQQQLRIVDIPGHERVRSKFLEQYKYMAKGIVYVIDSVTLQKDIRDVADYLYTILADQAVTTVPILILCNKQDETMAKGCSVIKNLLEKEMNLVRSTRMNQLKSVDNSANSDYTYLGKQGRDFEFTHLTQNIEIVEGSAQKNELTSLYNWLDKMT